MIIDDMISADGTIRNAVEALLQAGSREHFIVAATHPVFTSDAKKNLNHPSIRRTIVTDSIPFSSGPLAPGWRHKSGFSGADPRSSDTALLV